jgi:PAS domain S-box-containing protein
VLFNGLTAGATIGTIHLFGEGAPEFLQTVIQLQGRAMVFNALFLVLAAAFEERHLMRQALEQERQALEARVAERTGEIAHFLSLLHSSLESTADGLLVVDRQGRITATNERFAGLWGMPPAILKSGEDARVLAFMREQLEDPEAFMARVEYLYAHPELESEDAVVLKGGRVFERFSRPQRLGDGVVGRVWSFRDVTSRKRAEAERDRLLVEESRARQEAERAFHAAQKALGLRDEFLLIAAHEMRTPLTSMKMQIQQLQRLLDTASGAQVEAARLSPVVSAALRQMRRFLELCEQLLDIGRLSSGRLEPRYEPLDLREVVAEVIAHHAEAAARVDSELRLEGPGTLPGQWDRLCLERIVSNLLSNAIKFGAGSAILVHLEARERLVRLQVRDHGIGIASEARERIFERLERAVDSRNYGGLGLGLWIARESARALGGHITVESEPGKGSTFTVELPLTPRPPVGRGGEAPAAEAPPPV